MMQYSPACWIGFAISLSMSAVLAAPSESTIPTVTVLPAKNAAATPPPRIDVLFSPDGGCEARVVAELGKAKKSIRLQGYTFTSQVVALALADAHKRGVDCEVILDKSNATDKFTAAPLIKAAGIPCWLDEEHMVANNKVLIIDDATVLTGSYNFTRAAESANAENLLVMSGMPDLARAYIDNYARHRAHVKPYSGPSKPTTSAPANDLADARKPRGNGEASAARVGDTGGPAGQKVYITPNGKRYHRAGCEFLRGSGRAMERADLKSGLTPCSKCRP